MIEDAIIQGITSGGAFGITSYFLIKYVVVKLDNIKNDTTEIKTCLEMRKKSK
jgi:hypothetical protein